VDLDEILHEDDANEGDLDSVQINSVALAIPKWRTFKLLRWVKRTPDNVLTDWLIRMKSFRRSDIANSL
jgi:hypothetical protein